MRNNLQLKELLTWQNLGTKCNLVREIGVWIRKLEESRTFQKSNCIAQDKERCSRIGKEIWKGLRAKKRNFRDKESKSSRTDPVQPLG